MKIITVNGYTRRTYDEIVSAKEEKAKLLFGENIDTAENCPLGKFIRINAYEQAILEEACEGVYYSIFPHTATGVSLDRLCVFAGIHRNSATNSRYNVTFTGTAGAVIPAGFLVATDSEIQFATVLDLTIGTAGTVSGVVVSVETGTDNNVAPADINYIVNPSTDVDSVLGTSVVSVAIDTESDVSLRKRLSLAQQGRGACNENSIRAGVMAVNGVTSVGIVVNETDTTDAKGRPARSFETYVKGATDKGQEIANAIFDCKPIGIKTYGTQSETVVDNGNFSHIIKFSYVTNKPIYVKMTITTDSTFQTTGKAEIKSNITTAVNDTEVGGSVVIASLYGHIFDVEGVTDVTSLELSTDGTTYTSSNISLAGDECAVFTQIIINGEVIT